MLGEMVQIALESLRGQPLRSLLTMLGIIIGTASVITLISVGQGVRTWIGSNFGGLGADMLQITPGTLSEPTGGRLTSDDAHALATMVVDAGIVGVAPELQLPGTITFRREVIEAPVRGITAAFATLFAPRPVAGRLLTDYDDQSMSRVAVLGWPLAKLLLNDSSPLGKEILINGYHFTVVGVLGPESTGSDQGFAVFIPLSLAQHRLGAATVQKQRDLSHIYVRSSSPEDVAFTTTHVAAFLRMRHGQMPTQEDAFTIQSDQQIVQAVSSALGAFTAFLGFVGSVSLVVGGVGVMNIMLVIVAQRRKEIGIRRAVGARQSHILLQFLTEAVILCLSGGFLGALIGVVLVNLIGIGMLWITQQEIYLSVETWVACLALGVAALTGLVSGTYPATHAATLRPIDALHAE